MRFSPAVAACTLIALTACGSGTVRETLGINRSAPDEFRVVSRPPLSVPPQFNLRPPSVTAESPTVIPADSQAKALVLGKEHAGGDVIRLDANAAPTAVVPVSSSPLGAAQAGGKSAAESQFLQNVGASKADPNVRQALVEKDVQKQLQKEESDWWDILSTNPEKKDPQVNAQKEAERIRTNKDTGKPVTEGATPEVKGKDRGVLGRILGE
jgi:hypothetical protein